MKPLIVIPARGGSKGIPGKNIKELNNKPLIHYTIEAARSIFHDDIICVSTDSEKIKEIVELTGLAVPFLRPAALATDTAGTYEVLLHALRFYEEKGAEIDTVILLQVTSPFRTGYHIKEAIANYSTDIDMLVSVKETKSNPYYVLFEEDEHKYLQKVKSGDYTRRQDCPEVWEYNGAIYIINAASLKKEPLHKFRKVKKFVMDEFSSLDIDSPLDWKIAETIVKNTILNNSADEDKHI